MTIGVIGGHREYLEWVLAHDDKVSTYRWLRTPEVAARTPIDVLVRLKGEHPEVANSIEAAAVYV